MLRLLTSEDQGYATIEDVELWHIGRWIGWLAHLKFFVACFKFCNVYLIYVGAIVEACIGVRRDLSFQNQTR